MVTNLKATYTAIILHYITLCYVCHIHYSMYVQHEGTLGTVSFVMYVTYTTVCMYSMRALWVQCLLLCMSHTLQYVCTV